MLMAGKSYGHWFVSFLYLACIIDLRNGLKFWLWNVIWIGSHSTLTSLYFEFFFRLSLLKFFLGVSFLSFINDYLFFPSQKLVHIYTSLFYLFYFPLGLWALECCLVSPIFHYFNRHFFSPRGLSTLATLDFGGGDWSCQLAV